MRDDTGLAAAFVGTPWEPESFSTLGLPPPERFDAWRSHIADIVDLSPGDEPIDDFPAHFTRWEFGGLVLTRSIMVGAPERSWRHVPRSYKDHWCLVFAGPSVDADAGADPRAHVSFRSLALPYQGKGRDSEVITLMLPRDLPRAETEALDRAHDVPLPTAVAGLLADFLKSLAGRLSSVTREEAEGLADAVRHLVVACTAPKRERAETAEATLATAIVERARHVVRQNMASYDFGPHQLCRLMAVSRSKLYRMFEDSGGVGAFIQRERLQHAFTCLSDPRETRSINVVANDVGFPDHSTFSRAFRRAFGLSPSEAREIALSHQVAPRRDPFRVFSGGQGASSSQ
jgi:AraC-like DNA-binding protein